MGSRQSRVIVIRRAVGVALFRKDALFDLSLDNRATADAALLVSGLAASGYLWDVVAGSGFSLRFFLSVIINSVMVWIVMAGLTFLTAKLALSSQTPMSSIMRMQGFCYLPLLLATLFPGAALAMVGRVWFLATLVFATAEVLETAYWRAALVVGGSLVGLFVVGQLLWGGRLF